MTTLPNAETLQQAEALLAQIPLDRIPAHQRPRADWMLDDQFPISSFVGREDLLKQLAAAMASTTPTMIVPTLAITGMGGIGKTSLALEFAYRYGHYFAGGVYWINADYTPIATTAATILPSVDRLWQKLFPQRDSSQISPEQRLNEIKSFFNSPIPRLLIFDNCEQQWIFESYRPGPQSGCRVLMTSRNAVWSSSNVRAIAIDLLTPAESRQMLQKLAPRVTDAEADDLAKLVGYLPLALHVMGVALGTLEPSLPVANYYQRVQQALVAELETSANTLQNLHRSPTNHQWSVVATVRVSYGLLKRSYQDEAKLRHLLLLLACCAPNAPIPIDLLVRATEQDSATVGGWLYVLRQSGFFDHDPPQLHPLMREAIRIIEAEHYPNAANIMTAALVAEGKDAHEKWQREAMLALVPHLSACHETEKTKQGYTGNVLAIIAQINQRQGNYRQAEQSMREVLEYEIAVYGYEKQEVITTQHNLANILYDQGLYIEALNLFQEILTIEQQILDAEHPHILATKHELARVLQAQGEYAQALELYQTVLASNQRVLGTDHPSTLASQHNIASVFLAQGDYIQAQELYQTVFTIQQRVLGENHPSTLAAQHELARVLVAQGNYVKAQDIFKAVLVINQRNLGTDHPHTLTTQHELARVFLMLGDYDQSLDLFQTVLVINQRVLGAEHPLTLSTQHHLASIFLAQGNYVKAQEVFQAVLPTKQQVLGAEHPDTLATQHNIASIFYSQEAYDQALDISQTVLNIEKQTLGDDHPDTLITQSNIAVCMARQGQYYEAVALFYEIIPKQIRCYGGTTHPKVQASIEIRDAIVAAFWQKEQG
ncbi:tetratricopeptide repeat protein [Herpetosiphon sp.]|uniref:Tetratricopeptide TPR_4 n=1 Tax=Herpetosiphon aurantiacus (strain ATCC 23779 / DSM 785 / 114-95) TaxID=316274 RepID=A9AXT1_HERA2|nr:tetratricopeptide repeat protein [Herpetosiphon sp.]ABX04897.1 Tetratricopeptide TPR_4 [Herpetosiphon aurantiacus DSM 785]